MFNCETSTKCIPKSLSLNVFDFKLDGSEHNAAKGFFLPGKALNIYLPPNSIGSIILDVLNFYWVPWPGKVMSSGLGLVPRGRHGRVPFGPN